MLFGLGRDAQAEWIEVTWPNDKQQRFANAPAGSSILIMEDREKFAPVKETKASLPDPLTREDLLLQTLKLKKAVPISVLLDERGRVQQVIGGWSRQTASEFEALTRQRK